MDRPEEKETTDEEFIANEFDGLEADMDRSAMVDFGLPLDLRDISPSPVSDSEFEASGEEKTRAIGALEFRSNTELSANMEFDVGATFQASQSLFASTSVPSKDGKEVKVAPLFPFYLKAAKTSFTSGQSVPILMQELEHAFESFSVHYNVDEKSPFTYACSMLLQLALVEFEVRVFAMESQEHLVEFHHMSGCRYSFSDAYSKLSETFGVTHVPMKLAPIVICDDFDMPTLSPSPSCVIDHEMSLLSDGAGLDLKFQGARAVGSSTDNVDMFIEDGFGMPLANRISELASSSNGNDELRSVCMGSVANLASMENVSMNWLNNTVDTVVAGVEDDHPHIRREALRSLETMSKRDSGIAAKFVRAGVVPLLEIEACGNEEAKDIPAQKYARSALATCRA